MTSERPSVDPAIEAIWREALTNGHAGRGSFLPADPRCMICRRPFRGLGGRLLRSFTNYRPARMTPNLCNICEDHFPPGGAEVDVAVLFADLRGSTTIGAAMGSSEYASLVNRFYEATAHVLIAAQSWIDKLVGDEIIALYVPSMGPDYRRRAVSTGIRLLEAVGYSRRKEPWMEVGVGINAGPAFVGKVGTAGVQEVTALGDTVNVAARIQSQAGAGELLLGEELYRTVAEEYPDLEQRHLTVKGKDEPVAVRVLRPAER